MRICDSNRHLTVVTSNFNGAHFLKECIESVRSQQGVRNWVVEHVVVDAASKDHSVEILKSYPQVRWISEPDQGQCDGFNKGVSLASGEWICWLNADDKLCPDAVSAFERKVEENPKLDVIYGHVRFIDEESKPVKVSYHLPYHFSLVGNNCYSPPSSGTFFRKSWLLREPLDVNYHYVMDVEWFLRCGDRIKANLVDQVLSEFRISSGAKTSAMIVSGRIGEAHARERECYRRKHIYSRWPKLSESAAKKRLHRRRQAYQILYYMLKLRYILRYVRDRGQLKT